MSKARHYSKAKLLWNNMAYCDQWNKVMAVYDENENLRAVIKEICDNDYDVLLIGDDDQILYKFDDIELGSTSKNLSACFEIYCRLQYFYTPSYLPSYRRTDKIQLYQIFTHTRVGAQRTGGFHVTGEDAQEKIAKALEYYDEIVDDDIEMICCTKGDYDDDDNDEMYVNTIWRNGLEMRHVGDGAYCDDDGDNWDFL